MMKCFANGSNMRVRLISRLSQSIAIYPSTLVEVCSNMRSAPALVSVTNQG